MALDGLHMLMEVLSLLICTRGGYVTMRLLHPPRVVVRVLSLLMIIVALGVSAGSVSGIALAYPCVNNRCR